MSKAFVLLSGGIDSTTCLYLAKREFPEVEGVSINYGQRHKRELSHAAASCALLQVKHTLLDLSSIIPRTMLTDRTKEIPEISYADIEGVSPTYVPFRNGLMLSALASYVHGEWVKAPHSEGGAIYGQEWAIYFGAHAEDANNWAYPDCTPEFIGAMANAIYIGTYRSIRLYTPFQWCSKSEIIDVGQDLEVDWKNTWSCYVGGDLHCGVCPTCRARRAAFKGAGFVDPTVYARNP